MKHLIRIADIIFKDFADLIFPRTCVICKQSLDIKEDDLCVSCLLSLPIIQSDGIENQNLSKRFWGKVAIKEARAFLRYEKKGGVQKLFAEIKYKGQKKLAFHMGELFGAQLERSFYESSDLLIAVPLHRKKQKIRGFNQSQEIANGLSYSIGIQTRDDIVIRNKNTVTQTKLDRVERWDNVDSIFKVLELELVKNKSIIILDDVITTGSTLESLASTLLNSGAKEVRVIALAMAI